MSDMNMNNPSLPGAGPHLTDRLTEDYQHQQLLLNAQPTMVQRFLEAQGAQLAQALVSGARRIKFTLPDRVVFPLEGVGEQAQVTIPAQERAHSVGGFFNSLRGTELYKELRHAFTELEQSPDRAVSIAAGLLRLATVKHLIYQQLPAGRSVTYQPPCEEEPIPYIPEDDELEPASAITASTDAIAEEGGTEEGRGDLLVPFVPYARKFYLPQWVAFGENGELLAKSLDEANAHIKSMQKFMEVLFLAVALAPYISTDPEYVQKRYGMLGQLINQGRALATYQTQQIIERIRERANNGSLNRGLRLSLPYFNDQELKIELSNFEVIPSGRIMFVPAFVVRAVRQEEIKVSQDTRYNPSTRKHLLTLLSLLERAFNTANR